MQAPLRLLQSLRPTIEPGLVGATAVSTLVMSSTPLLLPDVIDTFSIDTAVAGLLSSAQLLGFVVATWGAGRFASAGPRAFVVSSFLLAGGGAVSAMAPTFPILVAARGVAGLALGAFTWLAWSEVFGDREKMGDVSVIGPASAAIGVPLVGLVLELADFRVLFAVQAVLALVPLMRVPTFAGARPPTERAVRHRPVAAAVALIAALGLLTAGGSATFAYAGVIARDQIGLGAGVVALLFSANAVAGIPSARWRGERPLSGGWALATAVCALVLAVGGSAGGFSVAIVAWGFFFWAGIPGLFTLLSERSQHPAERAGDAQAVMAAGRVIGPVMGGAAIGAGSFTTLGVVSALILSIGGGLALAVELRG